MGTSTTADLTDTQRIEYEKEEARANRTDVRSRVEDTVKKGGAPRLQILALTFVFWALHVEAQYVVAAFLLVNGGRVLSLLNRRAK